VTKGKKKAKKQKKQKRELRAVPRHAEVVAAIELELLQVRQDGNPPTPHGLAVPVGDHGRREALAGVVVVVQCQSDLLQVVAALRAGGCRA